MDRHRHLPLLALMAIAIGASTGVAQAQETGHRHGHHVRQTLVTQADGGTGYRGLTITRPPEAPASPDDDGDIFSDGPVRYNDIRDFSPAPYTTSGVQFPYGLDGIGGYGSDLDYGAADDQALYNRGAGTRP